MNYRRYYNSEGRRHCHVVETRHGRFEAGTKIEAELLAQVAESAYKLSRERAENFRQIALEEQRLALDLNESRRGGR